MQKPQMNPKQGESMHYDKSILLDDTIIPHLSELYFEKIFKALDSLSNDWIYLYGKASNAHRRSKLLAEDSEHLQQTIEILERIGEQNLAEELRWVTVKSRTKSDVWNEAKAVLKSKLIAENMPESLFNKISSVLKKVFIDACEQNLNIIASGNLNTRLGENYIREYYYDDDEGSSR
jgi:hypothetical protein